MVRCVTVLLLCLAASPRRRTAAGQYSNDGPRRTLPSDRLYKSGNRAGTDASAPETCNGTARGCTMDAFRLPGDVRPVSYALEVATDFARQTFDGRANVTVRAVNRTCRITMNAKDVRVTGVRVTDGRSNQPLTVADYYLADRNEQLIVTLDDTKPCLIQSREYVVRIEFDASLRDDMSGYYKSSYKEDGDIKWLAVTKFEPTHARKAFPCFDEPAFKTPFKVSISRRFDQISLSNMPLLNSTKIPNTNMYWDHFQETPPISTYLVAFFVGEFYAMKTRTVGVYTRQSYVNQAEYIAQTSSKLLKAMENFTGVEYMLPKLDLLAIPDFAAGAMENWGLNTYRERLLLLSDDSKTKIKEYITTVVQHELSHQWFGDLVTCAWWDFLWLNEGFATFFEYMAAKTVEPEWRLEDVFVYEVHQVALEFDQTPAHPISGSVKTPVEIRGMFDDISYSKAGSVLRMLQYTVSESNFKEALNFYLNTNAYKAATPEELWIAFENVLYDREFELGDNFTVTQYMRTWTEQAGYPLVKIVKENDSFVVTQERFLVNTATNEINKTNSWIIGLTYTTESEKDFTDVMPKLWLTEKQMVLSNKNVSGWYIFNLQSIGFYRVDYDADNWNALINQLETNHSLIHVLNRAQLINDAFNLAFAKRMDYTILLRLSEYLKKEYDVLPWYSAKYEFEYLMNRMRRCPNGYKYLKIYLSHLSGFIYSKTEDLVVLFNNTDHSILTGWNSFSNWACRLDNEDCMKSITSYFRMWQQGIRIPADIKDAAYCVGVKNGGPEVWNSILEVYVNSRSASDRHSAQLALACTKNPDLLSKYLDFMFEGYSGPIRPQDFRVIYQTLATTEHGIVAMIEFLTYKLDRILNEVINGEQVVTSIYSILASRIAHDEEISKIDGLRYDPSVPERLRKKFNASYGEVEDNLAWFDEHHSEIGEWTKAYVEEHGLNVVLITNSSTVLPETSSDDMPQSSGTTTLNARTAVFISLIISLALLLNDLRTF